MEVNKVRRTNALGSQIASGNRINLCAVHHAKFVDHPSPITMELSYITSRFNIVQGQFFGVESISGIYNVVRML